MVDNNYHLQHLINTLAFYRLMKQHNPDFDYDRDFGGVIYLFLRGVRKDSDTGVFFHKEERDRIERLDEMVM